MPGWQLLLLPGALLQLLGGPCSHASLPSPSHSLGGGSCFPQSLSLYCCKGLQESIHKRLTPVICGN